MKAYSIVEIKFLNYQSFSLDGINYQEGLVFDNLAVGTYTLFMQNAEDCIFTQELNLVDPGQLFDERFL